MPESLEIGKLISIFGVGVFASFIGAMAGSGGLITIPFLIYIGIPPHIAIATNKCAAIGLKIGATAKFRRTDFIKQNYLLPFLIISVFAALAGAQLLLVIDKEVLSRIVIILLLLVLPLLFLKRDLGLVDQAHSRLRQYAGYAFYFFAQVFSAFFGGGAGTMVIYILMFFFGFTIIQASATAMIPSLVSNGIAFVIFAYSGYIDYEAGIALFFGTLLGGWLGAMVAVRKGNRWVKTVFVGVVIVLIVKIVLE